MLKRRELLFNLIGTDDDLENGYLSENLRKILGSKIDFKSEEHSKIFKSINKFYQEYGTVPSYPKLVSSYQEDPDTLAELNKIFPLDGNKTKFPLAGVNFDALLDEVKEDQYKKELTQVLKRINVISEAGESENTRGGYKVWRKGALAAVQTAFPLLFDLESKLNASVDDNYSSKDVNRFFYEMLEDSRKETVKIQTGFPTLDASTYGGMEEKCFWVISAPAGMLKSSISLMIAYYQFLSGYTVEFVSLEMTSKEMNFKMQALHSANETYWGNGCLALPTNLIANPYRMEAHEKKRYKEILEDIAQHSGEINFYTPHVEMSVPELKAHLISREIKLKKDIDVVYVDHGELIKHQGNSSDGYSVRVADSIRKLRHLSRTYRNGRGIRIAMAYQIKREGLTKAERGENGAEGIYSMTDLSWTTEAERSATFILCSYYHKTFYESGKALLSWSKNRNGPRVGKFEVSVEMEYSFIEEIDFLEENENLLSNFIKEQDSRGKKNKVFGRTRRVVQATTPKVDDII